MTRKEFLSASAALAAGAALGQSGKTKTASSSGSISRGQPPPRNRHPYKGIDWSTAHQIRGTTHVHCRDQAALDVILKRIEFLTLSNYYPSAPWYPLAKMTENYYRGHHDFPVMVNGKREAGPFDWNAIVGSWRRELTPESYKKGPFPFKEGAPLFKPLPEGVLEAPNAEHHHFFSKKGQRCGYLHMNAVGSMFASGTFDQHSSYRTLHHGYDFGSGEFWGVAIDRMLDGLICPDGGGVTINHPVWSAYDRPFLLELLDYDPRVLGMEVIEGATGNGEVYWDWVLATGRQCFGFFVPDHTIREKSGAFGVNVLVTPERSVQACLKAYRDGNFYGAKRGLNELRFTRISFDGLTVEAQTDRPARLAVITACGTVKEEKNATSISWTMQNKVGWSAPRKNAHVFARIKAYALDGSGEELFSQPYLFV
jgi:hypothetical protein